MMDRFKNNHQNKKSSFFSTHGGRRSAPTMSLIGYLLAALVGLVRFRHAE